MIIITGHFNFAQNRTFPFAATAATHYGTSKLLECSISGLILYWSEAMMTLDQLEDEINQILTNFWSAQKSSGIKSLYEKIKTQIPDFPDINDSVFNQSATQAARNLLSNYAVHLYQQRLKEESSDPQSEKQKLHSYLYDKNWREFFRMVQLEYIEQPSDNPSPMASPEKIVYNLEKYDEDLDVLPPSNSEKGAPLALNKEAPISYVINIPPGEIKGIQVNVYGGSEKKDRKENLNKPGKLSTEDSALLAKGIAIVELNLVDILKLDVYQNQMPSHLHTELHDSINQFWETIHYKPEALSPLLSNMKEKPIFLRGASWGGRTAIRHAELYPNTFSGYISFDGSLSSEMASKSDKSLVGKRQSALPYLDPASHIADIQDPILLIHNANDNNVNIKVSLDFYEKAKKEGKENLLSVHINHKGNTYERNQGVWNTGHFSPNPDHVEFNEQINAVSNFIIYGPDNMPELTTWRILKYNTLSDRNYNFARTGDLFVEYVNRTYQKKLPNYQILSKILSVLYFISTYSTNAIRYHFNDPIPDSALEAGLTQELKRINTYLKEKYDIEFDATITSEMKRVYQDSILNADARLHRELLTTFILANPYYIDKTHSDIAGEPDYKALKRDAFIKLRKQRSAFHAASKTTLRSMIKRGQEYEEQRERQIKNGDTTALRNLIDSYNISGNAQTLTERLDRIFSQMPDNTKQNMLCKIGSEIITDLSTRNEIFEVLRNKMTSKNHENLLENSKSNINQMTSRWITEEKIERLKNIFKDIRPELKKEFISINFLRYASTEQLKQILFDLSDDEVYALFRRVDGKETALTSNHDISYLKYLKDRVGEERFKKLIEFDIQEGLKGSILKNYLQGNDFESFEFLINHLSPDALIEHIENNKSINSSNENLLGYLLKTQNAKIFEELISRLKFSEKSSSLRILLLDKDKNGNSNISYFIQLYISSPGNHEFFQQILRFCTPEDLASELKSEISNLSNIMRFASINKHMRPKYHIIQKKIG
ncbi:MAG: alpha/beta hydrolase family protein [Candidatus Berkiella sp.]